MTKYQSNCYVKCTFNDKGTKIVYPTFKNFPYIIDYPIDKEPHIQLRLHDLGYQGYISVEPFRSDWCMHVHVFDVHEMAFVSMKHGTMRDIIMNTMMAYKNAV